MHDGGPLVRGRAAPDSVDLLGPHGERQAFAPYRAARADRFRFGHLLEALTRIRDREEQLRISEPAGGRRPPVPPRDQPRRLPAREGDMCSFELAHRLSSPCWWCELPGTTALRSGISSPSRPARAGKVLLPVDALPAVMGRRGCLRCRGGSAEG